MHKLAIFTPLIGVTSESFITKHITDIYPGRTCVVTQSIRNSSINMDDCPILELDQIDTARSILKRGKRALLRKARIRTASDKNRKIKHFLETQRVKVVLSEYLDFSVSYIELIRHMGIKFYAHAHGYDVSMRLQDRQWQKKYLALNNADGIITVSHYSKQRLIEAGIDGKKIVVIPCGVYIPENTAWVEKSQTEVKIVAIGRMVSKKAPILLLDAFRRAWEVYPFIKLYYVGDGPLYAAIWQYIKAFQLEQHVHLLGALPNEKALALLKSSDIFAQHSITCPMTGDQEGLPVAILEALSYGVPVVTTRHAGIPEAVINNENGFLVEEYDSSGMAEKIVKLASDVALRKEMAQKARATAEANFSWETEKGKLLQLMNLN